MADEMYFSKESGRFHPKVTEENIAEITQRLAPLVSALQQEVALLRAQFDMHRTMHPKPQSEDAA